MLTGPSIEATTINVNGGHLLLLTEREYVAPLVYQFLREK